ncbi:MAG: hypothetical protein IKN75_10875 [Prevotella sp.]|nr:hypothetical protein [Prevotella sp.]
MKTIYMKPELTVIKINKPCLLNASLPEGEEYQSNQPVLSKDGGFWSDDEPEEVGW